MNRRTTLVIVILAPILLSGCFNYIPAEIGAIPEGSRVRAQLTPEGSAELERRTGRERTVIDGKLVERRGNSVVFSVRSVFGSESGTGSALKQHVDVQRQHIGRVERKEIDGTKTTLLIAGSSVALGAATFLAVSGDPVSSNPPGTGNPQESVRFPLVLFRFLLPH